MVENGRNWTDDLLSANQMLYQRELRPQNGTFSWAWTNDLSLIKRMLFQLSYEGVIKNGAAGRNRIPFGGFGDHVFTLNTATKWYKQQDSNL